MNNKDLLKNMRMLVNEECSYCYKGFCRITSARCQAIFSETRTPLDCSIFMERMLPPAWDARDLISYAVWYGKT